LADLEGGPQAAGGDGTYLAVCAIYRDEAPYLREWIEFHRLVGVERFFLYDNGSEDEHREVLAPYLDGVVELNEWNRQPGQLPAYDDCLARHREHARWIAFIDVDEFLFSPAERSLPNVLSEYESWPGVGATMLQYGTSGHVTPPPGLVIENYVWRLAERERMPVKSVVDPGRTVNANGAHHFRHSEGDTVDSAGKPLDTAFSEPAAFDRLRVNHYVTRSWSEWMQKFARARADTGELRNLPREEAMRRRDARLNEVLDDAIVGYVPALKQALADG
jgi:hypothetical protein